MVIDCKIVCITDGFRKIISTEAVNVKLEKDDMEFAHPHFLKDQEQLLEFIKRKVCSILCLASIKNALSTYLWKTE